MRLPKLFIPLFLFLSGIIIISTANPIIAQNGMQLNNAFPNLSFTQPLGLVSPDDGTNRIFVVTKPGEIYVFDNDPNIQSATLFLDIKGKVNDVGGEEGLLGLAFHPNFSENGYFFVDYTADSPRRTVIERYTVSEDDSNQADATSGYVILEVDQPYANHNGGQIGFGPDGYLYIALGDGGSGGDPEGHGQDRTTLLGAILRIDIDNTDAGLEYGIPDTNPFVDNTEGYREEIYAYGLRNPWRFSWDSETDAMWAADVGQGEVEEIDIIESGNNYGWNIMEGDQCYEPDTGCDTTGLSMPIWTYNHDVGSSITGGYVYRGSTYDNLVGKYIYGDFGSGKIWALDYDESSETNNEELFDTTYQISSFGVDSTNELYVVDFSGEIYILGDSNGVTTPTTPEPTDMMLGILLLGGGGILIFAVGAAFYMKKR
ncbi:MAG: putative glucose sorbosone dehydrogenase [Candidatus Thorarchaeota archaeon]|nr:MAG: putative glucose sorbosone dehydrogenase [Candidatus Thorarchaeota archaeon]